jgi:rhodanese-related sulfurtransferase
MKILIPFLVLLFFAGACKPVGKEEARFLLPPQAFNETLEKTSNAIVLDVRTPEEYSRGHIKNALLNDINNSAFEQKLEELDKDQTYFVYCKAGVRSRKARDLMLAKGFKTVFQLEGGIDDWTAAGLPTDK